MTRFSTPTIIYIALIFGAALMGTSCAGKQAVAASETPVSPQKEEKVVQIPEPSPEKEAIEEAVEEAVVEAAVQDQEAEKRKEEERLAEERKMLEQKAAQEARFLNEKARFEFDSAQLDDSAKEVLREKAAWLAANPDAVVTIEGHCDIRGTEPYNQNLGAQRAAAVKAYLVSLGIVADRLNCVSFGEGQPLSAGTAREDHQQNRRASFRLEPISAS